MLDKIYLDLRYVIKTNLLLLTYFLFINIIILSYIIHFFVLPYHQQRSTFFEDLTNTF